MPNIFGSPVSRLTTRFVCTPALAALCSMLSSRAATHSPPSRQLFPGLHSAKASPKPGSWHNQKGSTSWPLSARASTNSGATRQSYWIHWIWRPCQRCMSCWPVSNEVLTDMNRREARKVPDDKQYVLSQHYCNLPISPCNQLGNLLDNAAEKLSTTPVAHPVVKLEAYHKDTFLVQAVTDNGPMIPAFQMDKLFIPGFSSKHGGEGMGLFTVKQVLKNNINQRKQKYSK